jgi:hypothetical protein
MIIHKDRMFVYTQFEDEKELEEIVTDNLSRMFGDDAIKIPLKIVLETEDKRKTTPDLVVVDLRKEKWYIIEVELASHSKYGHVLPQIERQMIAVSKPNGKRRLIETVFSEIRKDKMVGEKLKGKRVKDFDVKHEIEQLIMKQAPIFVVPIDGITEDLRTWAENQKYEVQLWEIKLYACTDEFDDFIIVFPDEFDMELK